MIFERSRSHLKAEAGRVTVSERNRQDWVQVSLSSSVSVFSRERLARNKSMINRVQGYGEARGANGRWACEIRIVACILDWK